MNADLLKHGALPLHMTTPYIPDSFWTPFVREQAAELCSAAASSDGSVALVDLARTLVVDQDGESIMRRMPVELAVRAYAAASVRLSHWRDRCSEAEAMIRTGWSP